MLIFWGIRYFDRTDKKFKDRDLFLDTATLSPAKRAAVELLAEAKGNRSEREFLKFKSLFREESWADWGEARLNAAGEIRSFSLHDYFEDESGKEITSAEMGPILTGSPTAVLVPSGAKQHDIDYMFVEKPPVPVAEVTLSTDEIRLSGSSCR